MVRTRKRPLPGGRMTPLQVFFFGALLSLLSFVQLWATVNLLTALLALSGIIYYVVIYTRLLKRSSTQNIVIGGAAGAIPPLVGWAAAANEISLLPIFMFMIIFYWTPPHFWALALIRKKDYANAGVPMLPVVSGDQETKRQILIYTIIMVVLSLLPTPIGMMGLAYLVAAAALGLAFLAYVVRMMGNDTATTRWALYRFSLLYLFLLFMAMIVDRLAFG
jgi:heme o synthase